MATKRQQQPKTVGPATRGLKVVSRRPSFWRAGYEFTSEGRTIPLSELTQEQYDKITDEPQLVAHEVDIEEASEPAPET